MNWVPRRRRQQAITYGGSPPAEWRWWEWLRYKTNKRFYEHN